MLLIRAIAEDGTLVLGLVVVGALIAVVAMDLVGRLFPPPSEPEYEEW